jgi:hypothetical protein
MVIIACIVCGQEEADEEYLQFLKGRKKAEELKKDQALAEELVSADV